MKSMGENGEGKVEKSSAPRGLKQQNKQRPRFHGQNIPTAGLNPSNSVEESGTYGGATLATPKTHAPALLDGNTKNPKKLPVTGLPDAPNPGNMGTGGKDFESGGTFQNTNYPVGTGVGIHETPKGGNRGPVHDMRLVAAKAKANLDTSFAHKSTSDSSSVNQAADNAKGNFLGGDTGGNRAKAENNPYNLGSRYEKKGAHGKMPITAR